MVKQSPLRFSLRSLLLFILFIGSLGTTYWRYQLTDIDDVFAGYANALRMPRDLNESNGPSFKSTKTGTYYTLSLLSACAADVPINDASDISRVIPWCRHDEMYMRYIALECVCRAIGYDKARLSIPSMTETDHWEYYDILASARSYLDAHHINYPPDTFAPQPNYSESEIATRLRGRWEQDREHGFQAIVEFDGEVIRVIRKPTTTDTRFPEHTWTTKIKSIRPQTRGQFAINGDWDVESDVSGYKSGKMEPSQFKYAVWPVTADVLWFRTHEGGYWEKLKRSGSPQTAPKFVPPQRAWRLLHFPEFWLALVLSISLAWSFIHDRRP